MTSDRIGIISGPNETDFEVEQNTRTGSTTTRVFTGSLFECQQKRFEFLNGGASQLSLRPALNGYWILTAYFPFDENAQESVPIPSIHELDVNIAQTNVAASPKLRSLLSDFFIGIVSRISREYLNGKYPTEEGGSAEDEAEADINTTLQVNGASDPELDLGIKLFRAMSYRKADDFIQYTAVYRRTLTAALPAEIQASYVGVGEIWTTEEIIAFEALPDDGFFQLPAGRNWLKSPPHIEAVAHQKTQVVYYYAEKNDASYLYYDAHGSAILLDAP